jgi:hypothetical protein
MMLDALRVTWQSIRGFWEDLVLLVILDALWSLCVLLIVAPVWLLGSRNLVLALVLSLLLSWPLPVVSGALCYVANQIARGKIATWETFATGLRRYWAKSLAVALVNVVVLVLLAANIQFYATILQGTWTDFAVIAWIALAAYWLAVQIYWFPMILELESEKVLVALRNALGLVLVSPGFSLLLTAILVLLVALCLILTVPAMLFMAGLVLLIANHATRSRLALVQRKRQRWDEDQ